MHFPPIPSISHDYSLYSHIVSNLYHGYHPYRPFPTYRLHPMILLISSELYGHMVAFHKSHLLSISSSSPRYSLYRLYPMAALHIVHNSWLLWVLSKCHHYSQYIYISYSPYRLNLIVTLHIVYISWVTLHILNISSVSYTCISLGYSPYHLNPMVPPVPVFLLIPVFLAIPTLSLGNSSECIFDDCFDRFFKSLNPCSQNTLFIPSSLTAFLKP